ncbi:MAG: (Fe-S)-binding protein [Promethearchaeota archaeon]|nr:MAG: (Fe-S)-binding protein [Candidatus Lokiarchaeota archaeon]
MNFIEVINKCKDCRECENYCSIFLSTGKYGPHEKLKIAKEILEESEKPKKWETVFYCTKCEACDLNCPENIPITKIIDEARRVCVNKWGIQFPRQEILTKNIFKTGNPFGKTLSRLHWLDEPIKEKSKTLLHIGCMYSYILPNTAKSIVKILNKLDVDFTISPNENCCGYFVYNTGNHTAAYKLIKNNIKEFEQYDRIITACAGCTIFFKQQYGLNDKVVHLIEVVDEKLKEKNIELPEIKKINAIFHDSCHISRPFDIIKQPRDVLEYLGFKEGKNLKEFDLTKELGTCCGADGGMRIINKELAIKIGKERVEEASKKAEILFTLCPFCINNFYKAMEDYDIDIKIKSIFEELAHIL